VSRWPGCDPGAVSAARPTLVAVAHGTRAPDGPPVIANLLDGVRALLPGVRIEVAYVDVLEPDLATVLSQLRDPVVVVPLFLARGYHVRVDVPGAVSHRNGRVRVAPALGPDPAVIAAVADRHAAAVAGRPVDAVVLGATGSSDPQAQEDVETAARRLSRLVDRPTRPAYLSSAEPQVESVVRELRTAGHKHISLASYLLAPGLFSRSLVAAAGRSGVDVVADPIGAHRSVIELVTRRYLRTQDT
jgi:sirohydrochlorin ferrochelatase